MHQQINTVLQPQTSRQFPNDDTGLERCTLAVVQCPSASSGGSTDVQQTNPQNTMESVALTMTHALVGGVERSGTCSAATLPPVNRNRRRAAATAAVQRSDEVPCGRQLIGEKGDQTKMIKQLADEADNSKREGGT